MKLTISQIGCIVLAALMLAGVAYVALEKRSYDAKIVAMNNAIATKDKTIEVSQGLFEKATLETKDLRSLLDTKDTQITALQGELKQKDQELVTATSIAVRWKADYEALVKATQEHVPAAAVGGVDRFKVSFEKDFGPILVTGYTFTDPPEAFIDLHQQRPLKLTVAISQDDKGLWHTYSSSSETNISTEIVLSGVNPYFADKHWYERLSLSAAVAAGGDGVLAGLGVGVDISQFTASIMVFDHSSNLTSPLYGLNVAWRPFMK